MNVIIPTTITDLNLSSSNAPLIGNEVGAVPYTIGGTFALNAYATANDHLYKSVQGGNSGNALSNAAWWLDMGVLNKKAMFDDVVGTKTIATNTLTVVLAPGIADSLALLNISASTVTISVTSSGVTVYNKTLSLADTRNVTDAYTYMFAPIRKRSKVVLTDLPPYTNGVITITISGSGQVSCGLCIVGRKFKIGCTKYGASPRLVDYSKTTIDQYGNGTYEQGNYANSMDVTLYVDNIDLDFLMIQMTELRGKKCVWIGAGDLFDCLVTYGTFNDCKPAIEGLNYSILTTQINGQI